MSISYNSDQILETLDLSGDASYTMAGSLGGSTVRLVFVVAYLQDDSDTFNTPTASNVTFSSVVGTSVTGLRMQIWMGVSSAASVGAVTLTSSGPSAATARITVFSFTSTTGWTAPTDNSDSGTENTGTTHDSEISYTAAANHVRLGVTGFTSSGGTTTPDATYTALTGVTNFLHLGYVVNGGAGTVTYSTTTTNSVVSNTLGASAKEDAAAGDAVPVCWGSYRRRRI